jgi:hypothetical protein
MERTSFRFRCLVASTIALLACIASTDPAFAAKKSKNGTGGTQAPDTARRFAEAISQGDRLTAGQLDFSCQYRMVARNAAGNTSYPPASDQVYDECWLAMTAAHAPATKRTDVGMDVLWPSAGPLVFYGDELPRLPASAFVMDALGISPPGSGLRLTVQDSRAIPNGSFPVKSGGKAVGVPTTLVRLVVHYQDPLTSPVSYAAGTVKWANTVKRARRAVKSITTQWVVFTGLKKHGFPGDAAVFLLPVPAQPEAPGMPAGPSRSHSSGGRLRTNREHSRQLRPGPPRFRNCGIGWPCSTAC